MLIQFSIKNFKAFKDKAILSLVASNYDKERELENLVNFKECDVKILKSAVLYGANASGKSTFLEAFKFMRNFAINSSKQGQKGDNIDVIPFRLETESESDNSEFEVIFLFRSEVYRYGFEVNRTKIISEWLYHKPKSKEVELFYRDKQKFEIHKRNFSKGVTLVNESLVRENALMLSVAAQFNDKNAGKVLEWFNNLKFISGLNDETYTGYTIGKAKDKVQKEKILNFLRAADLGISDISVDILDIARIPKDIPKSVRETIEKKIKDEKSEFATLLTMHKKYDANKKYIDDVTFSLNKDESHGTLKFFSLAGPILDCLDKGLVLTIDELDSKLHPNLVSKIISLFNSKEFNPNNAQLIFNTHNTNLLSANLFRRDQIWFTQKDRYGAATLNSLSDFKIRKNENFEENYIKGRYGAIPYLAEFDDLNKLQNTSNENAK